MPLAGVVPLERLRLPPALSGAQGSNRADAPRCKTAARDDLEAVQAWLSRQTPASHTWRAYRREAERFLLWAVFERGQALSSLDATDCAAFRDFLAAPGADWVSPRHVPRWSTRWRPLEAGLSPASIATAVSIVRNLCGWLVRQRYLDADPWEDVPGARSLATATAPSKRSLSVDDWAALQRWLARLPVGPSCNRLRALLALAYQTGLRESELAAARTSWLQRGSHAEATPPWALVIPDGPGRASPRTIALSDALTQHLIRHLATTGSSLKDPTPGVDRPLFAHRSDPHKALTPGRIYTVLKTTLGRYAAALEPSDPVSAARFRQASTHWLRHTHAMHAVADGTPLEILQRRLGHRSPTTTAAYLCGSAPEAPVGERPAATETTPG